MSLVDTVLHELVGSKSSAPTPTPPANARVGNTAVATSKNPLNVPQPITHTGEAHDWVTDGIYYWNPVEMWSDLNLTINLACNAPVSNPWSITAILSLTNNQDCDFNVSWACTYPSGQATTLSDPPSPLPANSTLTQTIQLSNGGAPLSITYCYTLTALGKTVTSPSSASTYTGFPYNLT